MTEEPTILYVDDERANRVVFEQSFRGRFTVRCVESGEEAIEVLSDPRIAVLVTDQRMPGMSGHELLERARELRPDVVRIVITAYSDVDPILRAVNEGLVARYLVKPWDRAELEQILAWGVEAHELARQDSALMLRLMQTERLVTIGTIGSAVLHDLQQPILSLRMNSERLRHHLTVLQRVLPPVASISVPEDQRALKQTTKELPELVADVALAADVMQGIIQHLRSFLSPRDDRQLGTDKAASTTSVDPLPLVRYAMSACRESTNRVSGQVRYEGPTELPKVKMGSTELTQVLINLVSNAADSLGSRGQVVVSVSQTPEGLRFVINDNGAGMPAEVLRRAGTPFFSMRTHGTGLGLSQCRRLLGAVGARLELESTVGVGTTARFTLPIED